MNEDFIEPGDLKYEWLWRISWIINDYEGFQGSHSAWEMLQDENCLWRTNYSQLDFQVQLKRFKSTAFRNNSLLKFKSYFHKGYAASVSFHAITPGSDGILHSEQVNIFLFVLDVYLVFRGYWAVGFSSIVTDRKSLLLHAWRPFSLI